MKLRIEAKKENLGDLTAFCQKFLRREFGSEAGANPFMVAIEEVFVNIAGYAFPNWTGYAELELLRTGENTLKAVFTDDGVPFDPVAFASDERAKANVAKLEPGGLGIYIVKNTMKNLRYEYRGGRNIFSFEAAVGPLAGNKK